MKHRPSLAKVLIRQFLALLLLSLFVVCQYLQFHHYHPVSSAKVDPKTSNISHQCEICDFVIKKYHSFLSPIQPSVSALSTAFSISNISFYCSELCCESCIIDFNKGPPSLM